MPKKMMISPGPRAVPPQAGVAARGASSRGGSAHGLTDLHHTRASAAHLLGDPLDISTGTTFGEHSAGRRSSRSQSPCSPRISYWQEGGAAARSAAAVGARGLRHHDRCILNSFIREKSTLLANRGAIIEVGVDEPFTKQDNMHVRPKPPDPAQ